jgi:hypothetical protein
MTFTVAAGAMAALAAIVVAAAARTIATSRSHSAIGRADEVSVRPMPRQSRRRRKVKPFGQKYKK